MNKTWERLAREFKAEVVDRAAEVDPSNEELWTSLALGWAIAKGLPPEEAREFADQAENLADGA